MGMGDALADALREDRAAGAESAAIRARAEVGSVKSELQRQVRRAGSLEQDAKMWENHAKKLEGALAETNALASAGLIVINAMIKAMETMRPDQREAFREKVANLARARMQKLDEERAFGPKHVNIEGAFGRYADEQNKLLGIV